MKTIATNPAHEIAYQELTALMRRHADAMTPLEMLAVAANMVGKIIAMQDQRVTSPDQAMAIVVSNIQIGNAQVLQELTTSAGGTPNA